MNPNEPLVPPHLRAAAKRALAMPDEVLLQGCTEDFFIAGGPGGQHRNKTESAVRLRHKLSGVSAIGEDSRSQSETRPPSDMVKPPIQIQTISAWSQRRTTMPPSA